MLQLTTLVQEKPNILSKEICFKPEFLIFHSTNIITSSSILVDIFITIRDHLGYSVIDLPTSLRVGITSSQNVWGNISYYTQVLNPLTLCDF